MSNSNGPPKLNFDLLTSENLPSQSKSWPECELPVDLLLLTGETCELLSCLSHLNKESIYKSYKKSIGHVFFGKIGEENESMKIAIMESCVEATDTSLTVLKAIEKLGPKAVFCVGFCGGLDDTKVKLGDVVISKMVRTYASVSVMEEGIKDRNIGVPVPSLIGGIMKRADDGWIPPLENPGELDPIRHKEGVFLSGPEEVNNKKRCVELLKHFSDAVAIERQGHGLYKAAHDRNIQWAVIKGVSNFIDGREPNTDSWRQFASALAASLTFNILKDTNVFKEWPHYKSPSKESWSKKKESCPGAGYQSSKQAVSQTRPSVQGQSDPCASPMTATCTSTLPTAAQTQMALAPQAQPSVVMPSTQQQVPNDQVLYVPQPQYQSDMVATTTGVPGQVDVNTAAPHAVPTVQPVPQFTTAGQTTAHQRFFDPRAGTRLETEVPPLHTTSHQQYHWSCEVTPLGGNPVVSTQQLLQNTSLQGGTHWPQWTVVATPQPLMNVQPGNVYGQYRQQTLQYQTQQPQQTAAVLTSETVVYYQQPKQVQQQQQQQQQQQPGGLPSLMHIVPGAPHQRNSVVTATGAPTNTLPGFSKAGVATQHFAPPVMYDNPQASQLQVQQQQQQQQQPGLLPSLMDIVPGASHQGSSVVTAAGAPTNTLPGFSDASWSRQHSAPSVMDNSPQVSQLVNTPGWYPKPSQKRAADGDAGQQRPSGFHKADKRLRF